MDDIEASVIVRKTEVGLWKTNVRRTEANNVSNEVSSFIKQGGLEAEAIWSIWGKSVAELGGDSHPLCHRCGLRPYDLFIEMILDKR